MRRQSILVGSMIFFVVCIHDLPNAKGLVIFDDGGKHYVDYAIADDVDVRDSSYGKPTTVILLSGGSVNGEFTALDNSQITMSGGSVVDLESVNSSQIIMNGGHVVDDIEVHGESQLTISGGTVGDEIFVGWYSSYFDKSTLIISGGNFAIDGNSVDYGEYFASDYSRARITGTLANGDSLNNDFQIWDDSKLVLIPEPVDLNDGLVAYFPFNGNANDESGNGNNGTVNGAILTFDRFGNPDSAYSFDGLNDYIMISSSSSLDIRGNLTVAAWVKNNSNAGEIMWRGNNQSSSDPYTLNIEAGRMNLWVFDGDGSTHSAAYSKEQVDNDWHFWVGIYDTDRDKISLYKDGGLENSEDIGPEITYDTSNMWNCIGALGNTGGNPFGGIINDIRVYNRVLNTSEITELYQITEPSAILLLDPNGGESLTSGTAYPIKWSSTGLVSEVLIEYSVDNGLNWVPVNPPNTGNNGLYNWLVPAVDSNQCFVRVSDASDPNISDTSGDIFAIEQPVSGSIEAWGYNEQGQCEAPVGNDFIEIAGGGYFSLALKADGSLAGWGQNSSGQLFVPVGNDFVNVSAGVAHGLALKSDGSLAGWGRNVDGQNNVPTDTCFVSISAGGHHNLAIKNDGSVIAWGQKSYGQCEVPESNDFVSISGGYLHSLGLKADGSIAAWGNNDEGQCNVLAGSDFAAIAGGGWHSVALNTDGSLEAWGLNDYGQCDVPEGNDFVAIGAGDYHCFALKADGTIVAWGRNAYGERDVPDGNNFVAVAAGSFHGLAIVEPLIGGYIDWTDLRLFVARWLDEGCSDVNDWCGRADINRSSVVDSVDYSWLAKYWASVAPEPNAAGHPEPNDSASEVSITADLSWTAGADTAAHGVYFGTNSTPDANEFGGYQTATIFKPGTMAADTTYYWQVDEVGLGGETAGEVWSFTTSPVPGKAYNPSPSDSAINVSVNANLSWTANFYTASHDVYFGTNPTPGAGEFEGNQTSTTFDPGTLDYETTYYWRIDGVGPGGTTTGVIWSYTTEAPPVPGKAGNPIPADMATDVGITTCLNWAAGANTESHDVYFGTNPIPDVNDFQGNQTTTTFCPPSSLDYSTTYYWRIDEKNPYNTTPSVVWSFTTEAPPVPGQATIPIPANMATDVNITTCLNWTAGVNTQSHDVYLGMSSPGDFQGNQTETTFCPSSSRSLEYSTTYYWRIDEKNPYNTTTGDVWSFTTMRDPNLVGWWKFDETSGVIAYDSSGKENHGMLVDGLGNGLVWAPGEGALNFDGSNNLSRVVVSTVGMSTTEGTIAFWANLAEPQNRGDGRNGSGYFFGCDNGVKDRILLYMSNSDTQLDVRIGDHSEDNIITLGTLVWYHIALTWNRGRYVVYLNGIWMSAGTYDGLITLPSTAEIGNNGGSYKQSFHGLLSDVRVYDKDISPPDIQELYEDVIY